MTPQTHISPERLPLSCHDWLNPDRSVPVAFFPKSHNRGVAIFIVALLSAIPLAFGVDFALRWQSGAAFDKGDVASFLLVGVPAFLWGAWYLRREWRRKNLKDVGRYRIGLFIGADAVLWRTTEAECHFFPRGSLKRVFLDSTPVHRRGWQPHLFRLSGPDFMTVEVLSANDYDVIGIEKALTAWDPNLDFEVESRLSDHWVKERRNYNPAPSDNVAERRRKAGVMPDWQSVTRIKGRMRRPKDHADARINLLEELKQIGTSVARVEAGYYWNGIEEALYQLTYVDGLISLSADQVKPLAKYLKHGHHDGVDNLDYLEMTDDGPRAVVIQRGDRPKFERFTKTKPLPSTKPPKRDLPPPKRLEKAPADLRLHQLGPISYFQALLTAADIPFKMVYPGRSGMIEEPEEWAFAVPLEACAVDLKPLANHVTEDNAMRILESCARGDADQIFLVVEEMVFAGMWVDFICVPEEFKQ